VFVHGARADHRGAARATTEPPISDDRRLQLAREAFHAYESGDRGVRNTGVLTFAGEQIRRVEVYFGWELS
jgi:hypothetical protein